MVDKDHLSDKAQKDLELVHKAVAGDQMAYAQLMERYRESIYFMMLKMVNVYLLKKVLHSHLKY